MNEADTCREYVVPSLVEAGWDSGPHSIAEQRIFTDGRVCLVRGKPKRGKQKKADYLLRYTRDFPIAAVEAKADYKQPGDGFAQAKDYAETLDIKFAYSTNGTGIIEFDFLTGTETELSQFPSPQELWQRLNQAANLTEKQQEQLLEGFNLQSGKIPRYYQEIAINRVVAPSFLNWLSKISAFVDLCRRASEGTTNRVRLNEHLFLKMEIPLPPISEQNKIAEWIDDVSTRVEQANYEADTVVKRLDNLLMSAFHEIIKGVPHRTLEEIAPLTRRPAAIDPTAEYPGISTRSFGRGTFHNPPLLGSEITWQKPYEVKAGDILVSNIKAWEGAIAVVSPEDDGRFGSHRYLTFACKEGVATPRYVCFYLLSPDGLFHVGEASPGSADRNRTTGSKAMQSIPVPVPTYEQQLWFEQLYEKVETAKRTMTQAVAERNAILPSVLNQMFNGESQ